jgi:transketolase
MTDFDDRSIELRRMALGAFTAAGRGHLPSAFSSMEIVRVLYDDVLRYRPDEPRWPDRDRFIFSKGHGCLALYAILADKGFFPASELATFTQAGSILGGHPETAKTPGVDASTGALGHGLPIGIGNAMAARMQGRNTRVYVLMGDGETNEGTVWEAALYAAKHRVANLTAIVDYNKYQCYGPAEEVQTMEPYADKWRSFGFAVAEADGHDVADLRRVLTKTPMAADKPGVVLCHTVKGKGLSEIENTHVWHTVTITADKGRALHDAFERENA